MRRAKRVASRKPLLSSIQSTGTSTMKMTAHETHQQGFVVDRVPVAHGAEYGGMRI